MVSSPDNDNNLEGPMVFIIIGKAYEVKDSQGVDLHIMLRAPDDDTAVREALNALTEEGFLEAELDQIGVLQEDRWKSHTPRHIRVRLRVKWPLSASTPKQEQHPPEPRRVLPSDDVPC